jgi:hypothetical protein
MPCTPILAVGSRIDGPDDMNSHALQYLATVYAIQCLPAVSLVQHSVQCPATVFNLGHLFLIRRLSPQGMELFIGALPTARHRISVRNVHAAGLSGKRTELSQFLADWI